MTFSCATFAYPRLDTTRRGELAQRLAEVEPPDGVFILSTCLRLEIALAGTTDALSDALGLVFSGFDTSDAVIRTGREAVHHLFRVAAGLESPILGEREILTQYRRTVLETEESGRMSGAAQRLLQAGVAAARRARQTLPPMPYDSMAGVAAGLVEDADRVTVLGNGDMATAVIRSLAHRSVPPQILVLARQPEHIDFPDVTVWDFDRLNEVLATHPTIISATSATSRLLSEEDFLAALASRDTRLTLIDMAMPPDFAPPATVEIDRYDIDDLAAMVDNGSDAGPASAIVEEVATAAFSRYMGHAGVGPVIHSMVADADAVVERAVSRFAARLANEADESILRQTAHTVARAILSSPLGFLNDIETEPDDVEIIARAFRVTDG